jgi:transposase
MTVDLSVEAEIRRLHYAEHWPVGTVASQLGVHPDVVRRMLDLLEPRRPSLPRPRLVDPFTAFIDETLAQVPRLRATRLHDMIRARGYPGGVRTLREYVAQVRPAPRREAFLRLDPLIGEQAQVDWAHVGKVPVPGGQRSLWLFVMVLSWSRAMWAEFVFGTTVHSLLRSLVRAAAFFQGVTRQWLFANPKIIVLERYGDAVRFHPLLLELTGHFHVQLRLCAGQRGQWRGDCLLHRATHSGPWNYDMSSTRTPGGSASRARRSRLPWPGGSAHPLQHRSGAPQHAGDQLGNGSGSSTPAQVSMYHHPDFRRRHLVG